MLDALTISKRLISYPSITPGDHGAFNYIKSLLEEAKFDCQILEFGKGDKLVKNLYAKFGSGNPNLCFAGHLDVVPPGNLGNWTHNPFEAIINDGNLYGRGACDMKCAIGAYVAAAIKFSQTEKFNGTLSLLLTGDEEGDGKYGTKQVLKELAKQKIILDMCIVGEPTCNKILGDTIKIGRRGSITFFIEVRGKQSHVAYPALSKNPIDIMLKILSDLNHVKFDVGNDKFEASNLEIVSIDTGNKVSNIIPASIKAIINIRYNTEQNYNGLLELINKICKKYSEDFSIKYNNSAEPFISASEEYAHLLAKTIEKVTGVTPKYCTGGGTSDARFLYKYCPVIEFGLLNQTAHQVDEHVNTEDVAKLSEIYYNFIMSYYNFRNILL